MPVIKGPIKIEGGFNAREFLEEHSSETKIKLPFRASSVSKSTESPIELIESEDKSNLMPSFSSHLFKLLENFFLRFF